MGPLRLGVVRLKRSKGWRGRGGFEVEKEEDRRRRRREVEMGSEMLKVEMRVWLMKAGVGIAKSDLKTSSWRSVREKERMEWEEEGRVSSSAFIERTDSWHIKSLSLNESTHSKEVLPIYSRLLVHRVTMLPSSRRKGGDGPSSSSSHERARSPSNSLP